MNSLLLRGLLVLIAIHPHFLAGAEKANWPSFRGPHASGVMDGMNLPDKWDVATGVGIRFKVAIPGLAHSSPVIWGDNLFLTTAVSSQADASFKPGLYGSGEASEDRSVHEWQLLCLDKKTGKILWTKTATKGTPKDKRHTLARIRRMRQNLEHKSGQARWGWSRKPL